MLQNLHVKNLALIDEVEVDFQPGLNILTGKLRSRKVDYFRECEPGTWRQI